MPPTENDEFKYESLKNHYDDLWDDLLVKLHKSDLPIDYATHEEWGSQVQFKSFAAFECGKKIALDHFKSVKHDLEFGEWVDQFDTDGAEDTEGNLILTPQFRLYISFVTLE